MWDKRGHKGELVNTGSYSITCKLTDMNNSFTWCITGIYGPHCRKERKLLWWELAAIRGIWEGPWVVCGDFNTTRFINERSNNFNLTRAMKEFSDIIQQLELVDPPLFGGSFTWKRRNNQSEASRIDRILFSTEWDESFRHIRQSTLPRVASDHNPISLQCGEWGTSKSYFKFESWWLQTEGFKEKVKEWWESFRVTGRPDYILAIKLKMLKGKLKEWNLANYGNLERKKTDILGRIAQLDLLQEQRSLTDDELAQKVNLEVEVEEIARHEEIAWRQRSRTLNFFIEWQMLTKGIITLMNYLLMGQRSLNLKKLKEKLSPFIRNCTQKQRPGDHSLLWKTPKVFLRKNKNGYKESLRNKRSLNALRCVRQKRHLDLMDFPWVSFIHVGR